MSPEQKRHYVLQSYPGGIWARKVVKMTDAQIHAVYMRLISKKEGN